MFAKFAAVAGAACSITLASVTAEARDARCRIYEGNRLSIDKICDFQPEGRNGSFSITGRGGRGEIMPGISFITISVIAPGIAEVRGLTRGGINSRWGEFRRSRRDRACWTDARTRICVY